MNLTAIADGQKYIATECFDRALDYRCPVCNAPMILKRGTRKHPHFAHEAHSACEVSGETLEHLKAKAFMYKGLKNNPAVECVDAECTRFEGIRPDIAFKPYGMKRWIGIELQRSGISELEILQRSHRYEEAGVYLLWVTTEKMYKKILAVVSDEFPEISLSAQARMFITLHDALVVFTGDDLMAFRFENATREREGYNYYDGPTGEFWTETLKTRFVPVSYKHITAGDLMTAPRFFRVNGKFMSIHSLIQIKRRLYDDFEYFEEFEGGAA